MKKVYVSLKITLLTYNVSIAIPWKITYYERKILSKTLERTTLNLP